MDTRLALPFLAPAPAPPIELFGGKPIITTVFAPCGATFQLGCRHTF